MKLDSLELQLASALQRFAALQRRAAAPNEPVSVMTRALAELSTALEYLRAAQEHLIQNRRRIERLQEELRQQNERYWQLFDEVPMAYLVTRTDSVIVEVNKAGSELLNVSQRFLVGKALSLFICENRGPFLVQLAKLAETPATLDVELKLRPRERAPLMVSARVKADAQTLRWLLRPLMSPDQTEIAH